MPIRPSFTQYRLFVLFILMVLPAVMRAQALPPYCEQVSKDDLADLPNPYSAHQSSDHSSYCEGMLTGATGVHPVEIVSAKYVSLADFKFAYGATATLSWCRPVGVDATTHLSLRSFNLTSYALDAQTTNRFTWNSNLAARLHPDYSSIAALATSSAAVQNNKLAVILPVRQGALGSDEYEFVVHSAAPQIQLVEANVQSLNGNVKTLPIHLMPGPPQYWTIRLSLSQLPSGIYRLYFRDDPKASGLISTPIYFGHGGCS